MSYASPESLILLPWAQLFKGRLALILIFLKICCKSQRSLWWLDQKETIFKKINDLFATPNSFLQSHYMYTEHGDIDTDPGPNDTQTRSSLVKCFKFPKNVQSNHKSLRCEKCLSLIDTCCANM